MKGQRVYCPACDHEVELISTESTAQDGQASVPDAELACLDVSAACVHERCPVLAVPPVVLRSRLARHGMADHLPRLKVPCDSCGRVTEMIAVGRSYLWCPECGGTQATHLWDEMELPTESSDL